MKASPSVSSVAVCDLSPCADMRPHPGGWWLRTCQEVAVLTRAGRTPENTTDETKATSSRNFLQSAAGENLGRVSDARIQAKLIVNPHEGTLNMKWGGLTRRRASFTGLFGTSMSNHTSSCSSCWIEILQIFSQQPTCARSQTPRHADGDGYSWTPPLMRKSSLLWAC